MTIIQLEYLLAVANSGSFSQASEKCFVTQPSLSMQIKNLEEELGVVLLDRSKKPISPTDAGEAVLTQAREAIKSFKQIREVVAEMKNDVSGTLRLGILPTIAPYLLHRFLPDFLRNYPRIDLQVKEMRCDCIYRAMETDSLDAAILASGSTPQTLIEESLFDDPLRLYLSPAHPLLAESSLRIEQIDIRHLLLPSEGTCLRDQILELWQTRRGTRLSDRFESDTLETLVRHIDTTTDMATIVPQMMVDFLSPSCRNRLRPIAPPTKAVRTISIATRRTYIKQSLVAALKQTIRDAMPL